jgi:hypothetical protein
LVEPTMQRATEPFGERTTRRPDQLLDPVEAQFAEAFNDTCLDPQRRDRQQRSLCDDHRVRS